MYYKGTEIHQITLLKHPLHYLHLLALVIKDGLVHTFTTIINRWIVVILMILLWLMLNTIEQLYVPVWGFLDS